MSTFWGAIIGGIIAGVLTLFGVNKTIDSSFKGIELNRNQLREERDKEVALTTAKERLKELYQPLDSLVSEFIFKYGAHSFQDLTLEEQRDFILLMNRSIIYADYNLDKKFIEIKWAHKEGNYENANEIYNEITDLIGDELMKLREQLKLPRIRYYHESDNK
ncbi:hypothetical protein [Halalkalibacter krulwichiae]|uniref:hypothetical protein n=1 Tax=Halalkalibacter krulwichiae TaxID=199441 RepID=UPI0012ED0AA6|nr:hypothetical protein [Halalkalibacter krulwichiae]